MSYRETCLDCGEDLQLTLLQEWNPSRGDDSFDIVCPKCGLGMVVHPEVSVDYDIERVDG